MGGACRADTTIGGCSPDSVRSGKWKYEEDVYNPARFGEMVARYLKHKKSSSTRTRSH